MERLEEINQRLAQIQDELLTLADDDFARKNTLHSERDKLRNEAAAYRRDQDQDRPSSELIEELKARRSQLESIANKYVSAAKQADGSFAGTGSGGAGDAIGINKGIDEATGRAAVERRITALESILTKRGHL